MNNIEQHEHHLQNNLEIKTETPALRINTQNQNRKQTSIPKITYKKKQRPLISRSQRKHAIR